MCRRGLEVHDSVLISVPAVFKDKIVLHLLHLCVCVCTIMLCSLDIHFVYFIFEILCYVI